MYIFIFSYVSELTENYHSGGGLVVIAKDKKDVKKIIADNSYIKLTDDDWKTVKKYKLDDIGEYKSDYFVFPNAGCC